MKQALLEAGASPEQAEAEVAKLARRRSSAAAASSLAPDGAAAELELDDEDEGPSAALFLLLDTQWDWAPMGGRVRLRYEAIEPVARMAGISVDLQRLLDLRLLESTALSAWAEARR